MRNCHLLTLLFCTCMASDLELLIYHINNANGHFDEFSYSKTNKSVGGMARIYHIVKDARMKAKLNRGPPVLFLIAGDIYTGTIWFSVHKWKIASDFMNLMMPDAMCLGRSEFDLDIDGLAPFVQNAKFPILAANINVTDQPELDNIQPSVVLTIKERKVGIIGYAPYRARITRPHGNVEFEEEVDALKRESIILASQGVDIIIAMGSSGFQRNLKIARQVPHVDLLVSGGGVRVFLWNGSPVDSENPDGYYPTVVIQNNGKTVPVVHTYGYTKYLGKLRAVFDRRGKLKYSKGQPIFLHTRVPSDGQASNLLDSFRGQVDFMADQVVGNSFVYLKADDCLLGECNIGNLVCDSFIDYKVSMYKTSNWVDTSIALINSGAIIDGIGKHKEERAITRSSIIRAMPYDSQLVSLTLTGRDLVKALEHGVRLSGKRFGGEFLQVSGLHVVYDFGAPSGSRVANVTVRCADCEIPEYKKLDKTEDYKIVTTTYLFTGNDGHIVFSNRSKDVVVHNMTCFEATVRYMNMNKELCTGKGDRIIVLNDYRSYANLVRMNMFTFGVYCALLCISYYSNNKMKM